MAQTVDPSAKPPKRNHRVRTFLRIWSVIGVVFLVWQFGAMRGQGVDEALLRSDAEVAFVDDGPTIRIAPRKGAQVAGLVFFPGAMVDPDAYVPLVSRVARAGFPVVLVKLPWRSAPTQEAREFVFDQALAVLRSDSDRKWVIAGHSKGGALAAALAARYPYRFKGLVLIGTTHPKDASGDLSQSGLDVTKIFGTEDRVAPEEKSRANARLLPVSTHWIRIEGGNHAGFGYYGPQLGDGTATISKLEQRNRTSTAIIESLRRIEKH